MPVPKESKEQLARIADDLRKLFPRNSTVYTITRQRSRTGLRSNVGILCFDGASVLHPNYSTAALIGYPLTRSIPNGYDTIVAFNAGEIVERLASKLYNDPNALHHEAI